MTSQKAFEVKHDLIHVPKREAFLRMKIQTRRYSHADIARKFGVTTIQMNKEVENLRTIIQRLRASHQTDTEIAKRISVSVPTLRAFIKSENL